MRSPNTNRLIFRKRNFGASLSIFPLSLSLRFLFFLGQGDGVSQNGGNLPSRPPKPKYLIHVLRYMYIYIFPLRSHSSRPFPFIRLSVPQRSFNVLSIFSSNSSIPHRPILSFNGAFAGFFLSYLTPCVGRCVFWFLKGNPLIVTDSRSSTLLAVRYMKWVLVVRVGVWAQVFARRSRAVLACEGAYLMVVILVHYRV